MKSKISISILLIAIVAFATSCKKESTVSNNPNNLSSKLNDNSFPSSDNWEQLPGIGNDISVGANGTVYVTDTTNVSPTGGFRILKWNGSSWTAIPNAAAVRLAVDTSGNPWVINKSHLIFKYNGTSFQQLPGTATDIGIGANGAVYITDTTTVTPSTGYRVQKWNGSSWTVVSGIAGVRIAVDPSGNPWVVNKSNAIYRYNGSTFQLLSGQARDIGIGKNGAVYIVSNSLVSSTGGYRVSKWNGSGWTDTVSGAGINISVDPQGHPWAVNSSYLIYRNLNL